MPGVGRPGELFTWVFDVAPAEGRDAGNGFAASARAFHLGELLLVDTRFDGQQFLRTPRQVRTDWLDHFLVQYYREGGYVGEVGGEGMAIQPGSVSVLDLAQPLHTHATAAECLSLVVPRDVMAALVPGADRLHGRILDGAASRLLEVLRIGGVEMESTPDSYIVRLDQPYRAHAIPLQTPTAAPNMATSRTDTR
mgnify:CR=1 FL=1